MTRLVVRYQKVLLDRLGDGLGPAQDPADEPAHVVGVQPVTE